MNLMCRCALRDIRHDFLRSLSTRTHYEAVERGDEADCTFAAFLTWQDMIIRGGENIDCSKVERTFTTMKGVRECSVFGLPDQRLGEVVGLAAWVTDQKITAADVVAHANKKGLASFKTPLAMNVFVLSEELPKGATGKIDKKVHMYILTGTYLHTYIRTYVQGLREKYSAVVKEREAQPRSRL